MKLEFEILVNPGENAKFLAEMRIEQNNRVWSPEGWWGLWFTFWLYPRRKWREWLWDYENSLEHGSRLWQIMLCGFQITWQTVAKQRGGHT